MRFERKYRVETLSLAEIVQLVRTHPMSFRTLHPDRQVNNLYLDTDDLHFFHENLSGVAERHKLRLRWYGEDHRSAHHAFLEMKCKDGLLGEKFVVSIPAFDVTDAGSVSAAMRTGIAALWEEEEVRNATPGLLSLRLTPALLNTYVRSYLVSYNGKFRLTIDRQMLSYGFNARHEPHRIAAEDEAVVVEVKYLEEHDAEFETVGQRLPLRLSKNSKYVMGMLKVGNV